MTTRLELHRADSLGELSDSLRDLSHGLEDQRRATAGGVIFWISNKITINIITIM